MHKIIILPFLSIPLLHTVMSTPYCATAGSIFWAKYYKKEPTFQLFKGKPSDYKMAKYYSSENAQMC